MSTPGTFTVPIRFTGLNRLMSLIGILPSRSDVTVGATTVDVRMSWAFRAHIPRASVHSTAPYSGLVLGWGVHGWRGRWLVNGSSSGIVRIDIDPTARAYVMGFPVKLSTLLVAVDDPDGLQAALAV